MRCKYFNKSEVIKVAVNIQSSIQIEISFEFAYEGSLHTIKEKYFSSIYLVYMYV